MKLEILANTGSLCEQCVALCCRYYAFAIDKPTTRRDFEDLRWFMLHEDTLLFVEEGDWHIQVNRKCRHLLPDNRCGVYDNRPEICREYKTDGCDWHGDEYDYDELFTEPEQLAQYAKDYLAKQRKRKAAAKRRKEQPAGAPATAAKKKTVRRGAARKGVGDVRLLKSA